LSWAELACHDHARTPYPLAWRETHAVTLARTFEAIRALLGHEAIMILSGFRTDAYNATLEGAASKSQHVRGRALDLWHPAHEPLAVYLAIWKAQRRGELPDLGGLGAYKSFTHVDVRPKVPPGHLARWAGRGVTLPEDA